MRRNRRRQDPGRGGGSGQGRPAHEGHDPAPRPRRHRGDRPRRPRPRGRRRPDRGRGRGGGERVGVDLGPLPERRARSASCVPGSRCSTPPATTCSIVSAKATRCGSSTARSGATTSSLATAKVLTEPEIEAAMEEARAAIGGELERFADNTLEYVRREARLTFEPLTLPPLHTKFAGRHALVVVRGHDYRSDLAALRSVHPRVPAGADRCRRWRRRAARSRVEARRDHR